MDQKQALLHNSLPENKSNVKKIRKEGDDPFAWIWKDLTANPEATTKVALRASFDPEIAVTVFLIPVGLAALFGISNVSKGATVKLSVLVQKLHQNATNLTIDTYKQMQMLLNYIKLDSNSSSIDNLINTKLQLEAEYPMNVIFNSSQYELLPFEYSDTIFTFNLTGSVQDFWDADAKALAIIIAAFSGIWPYVKLIAFEILWLIAISNKSRHKILLFLDQFGKFSFVDLFVTVIMVVSFKFDIYQPVKMFIHVF